MTIKSKASQRGGALGPNSVIDVAALSEAARYKVVKVPGGNFTQNTTEKYHRGPLGFVGRLVAAYQSFETLPAGGALSVRIVAYDASENAEVNLTDTVNPEVAAATAREGQAFVLAATNVELQANDTIEIHNAADNNAVGTQQVDQWVTLVFDPTEDAVIDQ